MRFHEVTRDVERANMARELRLRTLFLCAYLTRYVPGDAAELGVYKGRSAILIARVLTGKVLHLFDTFSGMPNLASALDGHGAGDFSDCSLNETSDRLKNENAVFHKGLFSETCAVVSDKKFAFVHFDGDLYESCKQFIEFFWPRMSPGGIMTFDDYDWPRCLGVKRAIEEAGLEAVEAVDYQAFVVKGF